MKNSEYNSARPFLNVLSYIFLGCGIVLICLEILTFFKSEDYSFMDASDKYFMTILMLVWYIGLRYWNKKGENTGK